MPKDSSATAGEGVMKTIQLRRRYCHICEKEVLHTIHIGFWDRDFHWYAECVECGNKEEGDGDV